METEQLLHHIVGITEEFKAVDPAVLKVTEVCDFADYFVVVSGTSSRHVQALAEELILKCKHAGEAAHSIEGLDAGEWCLLDFGSVIVHVFTPEKREHYNIEGLWTGERAKARDVEDGDDEDGDVEGGDVEGGEQEQNEGQ